MNNYMYWYGDNWYTPYTDYLAALNRIKELEKSLVELREVDEADASYEATAPSDSCNEENTVSEFTQGYRSGYVDGVKETKAKLLQEIVKAAMETTLDV